MNFRKGHIFLQSILLDTSRECYGLSTLIRHLAWRRWLDRKCGLGIAKTVPCSRPAEERKRECNFVLTSQCCRGWGGDRPKSPPTLPPTYLVLRLRSREWAVAYGGHFEAAAVSERAQCVRIYISRPLDYVHVKGLPKGRKGRKEGRKGDAAD